MTSQRLRRLRPTVSVLLGTLLVVCLCYQAYRYPLQINSALTSPTYRNTPALLQYGKWALIAAIGTALALVAVPALRSALRRMPRVRLAALGLEVLLIVGAVVRIVAGADSTEPAVLLVLASVGLVVTVLPEIDGRMGAVLVRILVCYAVLSVIVELIQVLLFVLLDRLPALAYAGSPSVRFGSVLDDPNGFAVLTALLIPTSWLALRARPNLRLVVVVALLCCLPLSQSWTGIATSAFALALTWLTMHGLRRDPRRAAAVVLTGAVIVAVGAFFARSTIAELIRLKRGSAEDHAAAFARIVPTREPEPSRSVIASPVPSTSASHVATGSAHPSHAVVVPAEPTPAATWVHGVESGLVNLYVNYGPILLVAYIALGVVATVLLLRGRTRLPVALRAGGASYLICFLLASVNLGLDRTFPCNVLYFLLCGVALASAARDRPRPRPERGGPREVAAETAPADDRPAEPQPVGHRVRAAGRPARAGIDRPRVLQRGARLRPHHPATSATHETTGGASA